MAASGEQSIDTELEECPVQKKAKVHCPNHEDREAELYCETCEQLICSKCVAIDGAHISHDYMTVGEACEGYMREVKEGVAELEQISQEVSTQQEDIKAKILKNVEQLQADMETTKTQMLSEVSEVAEKKLATIKAEIEKAESTKELYQNPSDVQSQGVSLINKLKQAANTFRGENSIIKPDIGPDVVFLSPRNTQSRGILGQVLQCYATGEGLWNLRVGQTSTVTILCLTTNGTPYINSECLWFAFEHEKSRWDGRGPRADSSIDEIRPRRYNGYGDHFRLTLKPKVRGWHQLHIRMPDEDGPHIIGSPFRVYAE